MNRSNLGWPDTATEKPKAELLLSGSMRLSYGCVFEEGIVTGRRRYGNFIYG
ncbi:MAG: hypothetical protein K2O13_04575 [Lachnospiraceae bacterium]|nr:hypothetical protein [Lachnospiraceae bacterium]